MTRILTLLFSLLLASSAWGQTIGPASPQGGVPVGASGTFTAGDILVGGPGTTQVQDASTVFNGTSQSLYNLWAPVIGTALSYGTAGAPITTSGPLFKFSRTENIAATTCGSNHVDNECNATMALYSVATSASGMQNTALLAAAIGAQTGSDVVGASITGRAISGATGIGTGAYLEGRRDVNTARSLGVEVRTTNQTVTASTYNSAGASPNQGIWVTGGGTAINGSGISLGAVNGQGFLVGYAAAAGSISTTTFRDDSSSATSIQINGTHATAQIAGTGFSADSSGNITGNTLLASAAGTASNPAVVFSNCGANCGWLAPAANKLELVVAGINVFDFSVTTANQITLGIGGYAVQFENNAYFANNNSTFGFRGFTTIISSPAAATLQYGAADAASPVAQTIQPQSVVAGNANTAGANFTIAGSKSNGSGGGDVVFQTTLNNAASGTQNTLATAMTLKGGTQTVVTAAAVADSGYDYQTPSTGGTVTIPNGKYHEVIDPAATLATLTVNMPSTPIDGQYEDVRFSQVITALTVSGNGNSIKGNPTSAAVGSQFGCFFRLTNTTWYC